MISRHLRDRSLLRDPRKVEQQVAAAQLPRQMGQIPPLQPGTDSFFRDLRRSHRSEICNIFIHK